MLDDETVAKGALINNSSNNSYCNYNNDCV